MLIVYNYIYIENVFLIIENILWCFSERNTCIKSSSYSISLNSSRHADKNTFHNLYVIYENHLDLISLIDLIQYFIVFRVRIAHVIYVASFVDLQRLSAHFIKLHP